LMPRFDGAVLGPSGSHAMPRASVGLKSSSDDDGVAGDEQSDMKSH
jgi:hypothetical protein